MRRVNYKEIEVSFEGADCALTSFQFVPNPDDCSIQFKLYPFWLHPGPDQDHPLAGKEWRIDDKGDGEKLMTVYPKNIHSIEFHPSWNWRQSFYFTKEDPRLLRYENSASIMSNGPISIEEWSSIVTEATTKLSPRLRRAHPHFSYDRIIRWGNQPSFSLGDFPGPLFYAIRDVLVQRQMPIRTLGDAPAKVLPVLFDIDGDSIIADDFEVDLPEWEHKQEWIVPMHG